MDKEFIENPVEAYEKLKKEYEILEKVNQKNQEKIKKLNETLEEEFIAKQYGDEALFFTLMDIKEIVSSTIDCGEWVGQGDNKMEQILNKINEVI